MSEFDDLQKLLRLKRYEQPPKGYFERFAEEFKERQRAEMLRFSARELLMERVSTWMWGFGGKRWLYVGGASTALLTAGYFFGPDVLKFSSDKAAVEIADPVLIEAANGKAAPKEAPKEAGEAK